MSDVKRYKVSNRLLIIGKGASDNFDPRNVDIVLSTDYDAALEKIETLKRAIKRMTSKHISSPKLKDHIWARDCDACNAQKIGETALAAVEGATWSTQQSPPQPALKDYTARECDVPGQLYDVAYVDGKMSTRTLVVVDGEEKT